MDGEKQGLQRGGEKRGTRDEWKISHMGLGRETDECCFSGDGDRGRITEDGSGQMDEVRAGRKGRRVGD